MNIEFAIFNFQLFVAYKTAALECLNTILVDVFSLVTFGAVIHFHSIPGVLLESGDIFAPYVSAQAGNAVGLIDPQTFSLADRPMAGDAFHASHFDMCNVGEKHAVGLP